MPQLDFATYPSQLFWLFVFFILLYLILSSIATPRITKVIEDRTRVVQQLSEKAHLHRDKAEDLLAEYEALLQQARTEARERYKTMVDEVNHDFTLRHKNILEKMHDRIRLSEQELHKAKVAIQKDMHGMSLEVACAMLLKVANFEVSKEDLQKRIAQGGL